MRRSSDHGTLKDRGWLGALLALGYFGILEVLSWETSKFPPCILMSDEADGGDQAGVQACATMHEAIFRFLRLTWAYATHDNIIAFGTIAIASFTYVLYRATNKLWKAGEVHSERQLRAYVFPQYSRIINFDTNPIVQIVFKNSGQTPAYKMDIWATVAAAVYPLMNEPEAPVGPATQSKGDIGPGMDFHIAGPPDRPISGIERAGIRNGTAAVYIYGKLSYRDAFDVSRFTKFCFIYGGEAGCHPEGTMATYKYWNDAN